MRENQFSDAFGPDRIKIYQDLTDSLGPKVKTSIWGINTLRINIGFFFLLFEKSCFFHVIFWVIWVLKHTLNNFFFYDFQKVTLFFCCPESSGVGLNTDDGRGVLHEKWWGKYGLWKLSKKSIKTVFLAHFQ